MQCRVCGSDNTRFYCHAPEPRSEDVFIGGSPSERQHWFRCLACGSDTSDTTLDAAVASYDGANLLGVLNRCFAGDRSKLTESMTNNFNWFMKYPAPSTRFLDIGCNEGCGMDGMQSRGWDCYGFDINRAAEMPGRVVVAPQFQATLFSDRFGAVMLREVIEHVGNWRSLLNEAFNSLLPGGLFQIQTPRPCSSGEPIVYQFQHLEIFSVRMLQLECLKAGFELLGTETWYCGQLHMCRKP